MSQIRLGFDNPDEEIIDKTIRCDEAKLWKTGRQHWWRPDRKWVKILKGNIMATEFCIWTEYSFQYLKFVRHPRFKFEIAKNN